MKWIVFLLFISPASAQELPKAVQILSTSFGQCAGQAAQLAEENLKLKAQIAELTKKPDEKKEPDK